MVYRRINKKMLLVEQDAMEAQNSWEDSLEKDSKPKLRFPVLFSEEKLDNIKLDFPDITIREPERAKNINKITTVKLGKKTKGGLF